MGISRREFMKASAFTLASLGLEACGVANVDELGQSISDPLKKPNLTVTATATREPTKEPTATATREPTKEPTATATREITPTPEIKKRPIGTFGVYLPYHLLDNEELVSNLINNFPTWGCNSLVIDIKNESGRVNIPFEHPWRIESNDLEDNFGNVLRIIDRVKSEGIYLIGRQVVMTDNRQVKNHPELMFLDKGKMVADNFGNIWIDPRKSELIGEYNGVIAAAAVSFGFDEIQLDYIRFPYAVFDIPQTDRVGSVAEIVGRIYEKTKPTKAFLTADLFAEAAMLKEGDTMDAYIGQEYEVLGRYLDGICPMAYPHLLHWQEYDVDPYRYVHRVVTGAMTKLKTVNPEGFVNPWIQAYPPMGAADVAAQTKAALDAGAIGAFGWNPTLYYPGTMFNS